MTSDDQIIRGALDLLKDSMKIKNSSDADLTSALSEILNIASSLATFPPINLRTTHILLRRCFSSSSSSSTSTSPISISPIDYFCNQQLKSLITTYLITAAKSSGYEINETWFSLETKTYSSYYDDDDDGEDYDDDEDFIGRRSGNQQQPPPEEEQDPETYTVAGLVPILLQALTKEAHSLVAGEILRLFLHFSSTFLQAFLYYDCKNLFSSSSSSSSSQSVMTTMIHPGRVSLPMNASREDESLNNTTTSQLNLGPDGTLVSSSSARSPQLFEHTAFGILAPLLTDAATALRNHAAWQVLYAVLQTDLESLRPAPEVVAFLANNHLHAFLNLVIGCLRHAHPASRRFTLRLISDILQMFSDWNPISHCILQSPAIFFALLANTEGPPCAEHWQVYHILKMFIMFPKKCPIMRHVCYINRDALGQYAQNCAVKFSSGGSGKLISKETSMILSKLASMTPLTAEEAALIQCSS